MNRKGFTLIELLIVVVIIGILAAIAIPKFANTKEKAIVASMKTDLRNYVTAEEAYFADNGTYGDWAALSAAPYSVSLSQGNTVVSSLGNATGYNLSITNASVSNAANDQCGVYAGGAAAVNGATQEGVPACN
ncbi:MAG: type IV pilin protein [Gemmatimonadales bacterium]